MFAFVGFAQWEGDPSWYRPSALQREKSQERGCGLNSLLYSVLDSIQLLIFFFPSTNKGVKIHTSKTRVPREEKEPVRTSCETVVCNRGGQFHTKSRRRALKKVNPALS